MHYQGGSYPFLEITFILDKALNLYHCIDLTHHRSDAHPRWQNFLKATPE